MGMSIEHGINACGSSNHLARNDIERRFAEMGKHNHIVSTLGTSTIGSLLHQVIDIIMMQIIKLSAVLIVECSTFGHQCTWSNHSDKSNLACSKLLDNERRIELFARLDIAEVHTGHRSIQLVGEME